MEETNLSPNQDKSLQVSQLNLEAVISRLPKTLQDCVTEFKTEEQRLIATYAVTVLAGSLMPEVCIRYANKIEHPCLMLLISMPPASGKGGLNLMYKLVEEVNSKMRSKNEDALGAYLRELKAIEELKDKSIPLPKPPKQPLHLIPGNTTSSKMNEQLAENDGIIASLIMETETDGLTMMLSNKMGEANSILFRKAFHHEYESQLRKRKGEHLVISRPKLVIIVSGTPSHIKGLFRGNEDGLFSRFMIVTGNSPLVWEDVRPTPGKRSLDEIFEGLSKNFTALYDHFKDQKLEVQFQPYQWDKINSIGEDYLIHAVEEAGEYASSVAKRHANMLCRIATILTAVRHYESKSSAEVLYCNGADFETALWLVNRSFQNSLEVFKTLEGKKSKGPSKKDAFLNAMPETFVLSEVVKIYEDLGIKKRSANRYVQQLMNEGLLKCLSFAVYRKVPPAKN
jgi:hypothetical protein